MNVDVCKQCGAPAEAGRIFCKNCRATLRPPVPLIQSHDQSVSDLPYHERESDGILGEIVGMFAEALFDGDVVGLGEALLCLLIPLTLMFGVYLVAGMVYHLMYDPNAVDVASRLDLLSIDPDKWFPRL